MLIQTHDGLEIAGYVLAGLVAGGWAIFLFAYNNLTKTHETIWKRFDELDKTAARKDEFTEWRHRIEAVERDYISRSYHEQFRREFKEDMQAAILMAIAPSKVSIDTMTSRMNTR